MAVIPQGAADIVVEAGVEAGVEAEVEVEVEASMKLITQGDTGVALVVVTEADIVAVMKVAVGL